MLNFSRFLRDESGANALEYVLVMILIAFVIVTGAGLLGNNLNNLFNATGTQVGTLAGNIPNL